MQFGAIGRIVHGLAPVPALLLLGSLAAAQNPQKSDYLKSIELCNGSGRTSFEVRIKGCTALIDSGQGTTTALANQQCPYRQGGL
jgi:FlaG/FlaF family flagellin (archaellin)